MLRRDAAGSGGHFLVMDTGHGKTVTSLVYAYRSESFIWSHLEDA